MYGVCFETVQQVRWQSLDDPRPESATDAIVRVELAGLCGSDLHPFLGRETGLDAGTVMGHEFVGEIVETGREVRMFRPGDRVFAPFTTSCGQCFYCQSGLTSRCETGQLFGWRSGNQGLHGGQAEWVRVPHADGTLVPLQGRTAEIGLLLGDNLSTGWFCADLAGVAPQGCYVVIGCGTVGLLCILACRYRQAGTVLAVDPDPDRLAMARRMGARTFASPDELQQVLLQETAGRGADAVMELVGLPEAQRLACRLVRPGGTLSVIGCHCTPDFAFSPVDAYDLNLTYRTGRCPARYYMDRLDDFVSAVEPALNSLVTHRFAASRAATAYDVFSGRKDGCIKAVLEF